MWKGYFDPNEPDYRSCRETFHWAQVTVQSLLAAPASSPVRQTSEEGSRSSGSAWRPVVTTQVIITPEVAARELRAKSKAAAGQTTYATAEEPPPPMPESPAASPCAPQAGLQPTIAGSTPKAMPAPAPKKEQDSEADEAMEDVPQSAASVTQEHRGLEEPSAQDAASSAVSEKAQTLGEGAGGEVPRPDTVKEEAMEPTSPAEFGDGEGADEGTPPVATSAVSEKAAGVASAAEEKEEQRQEKGYWHRDSKKCQRVWRTVSAARPVKREEAAREGEEPVGLKLEQVEERQTEVHDDDMEEVVCEDLPAQASLLMKKEEPVDSKSSGSAEAARNKIPAVSQTGAAASQKRPIPAAAEEGPAAKARTDAEWTARRRALEEALELMDAERGVDLWLERHAMDSVEEQKNEQTVLHLLAEDIRQSPQSISQRLISDLVTAASQFVNVVSGPSAQPSGVGPLHQICAGNDSGALRSFCCQCLVDARADLEARDARGTGVILYYHDMNPSILYMFLFI